jgi:hypothetical protein
MGLKGYRLWVMGQLDSNVQSPTARSGTSRHTPRCVPCSERSSLFPRIRLPLTPRGCQIGYYMEHTGCHQLNRVF